MKKVWSFTPSNLEDEDVDCFPSLEIALDSIEALFRENFDITIEKDNDTTYSITTRARKGLHFVDYYYLKETPIYESVKDYLDTVADEKIQKLCNQMQTRRLGC